MKDKRCLARIISSMVLTYHRDLDEECMKSVCRAWWAALEDVSDEEFEAACKAHMQENRFFPSPADIRERILAKRRPVVYAELPVPERVISEQQRWSKINTELLKRLKIFTGKEDVRAEAFHQAYLNPNTPRARLEALAYDALGKEMPWLFGEVLEKDSAA